MGILRANIKGKINDKFCGKFGYVLESAWEAE